VLAAHADWSIAAGKRWLCRARHEGAGWRVFAPEPVGEAASLPARLIAEAGGAAVALGVDFPLGLPRAYVARHLATGMRDFPDFLANIAKFPEFFEVNQNLATVSAARPFYPARGMRGMTRAAHAAALGLASAADLSRACDRATAERPAGAPLFWTLGANQSGKAAIHAWRALLIAPHPGLRLWPFAGPFRRLLAPGRVVIAETYPAEAQRQLGIARLGSKRRQGDRAALAEALRWVLAGLAARPEPALVAAIAEGFGADAAGEDRFDCVLGLLAVLGVLAGRRPDLPPPDPWLTTWEGWVLGQTAAPRAVTPGGRGGGSGAA
jgi:hypothetical protein